MPLKDPGVVSMGGGEGFGLVLLGYLSLYQALVMVKVGDVGDGGFS